MNRFKSLWSFLLKWLYDYCYDESKERPNKQDVFVLVFYVLIMILSLIGFSYISGFFFNLIIMVMLVGCTIIASVSVCRLLVYYIEKD